MRMHVALVGAALGGAVACAPHAATPAVEGVSAASATSATAQDLAGLWEARRQFATGATGPVALERTGTALRATMLGRAARVSLAGDTIVALFGDSVGEFRGQLARDAARVAGFWIQPTTVTNGTRYASPLVLQRDGGAEAWRGTPDPLADDITLYLRVERANGAAARAFIRNPQRNVGRALGVAALTREGAHVQLRRAARGDTLGAVAAEGDLRADGTLHLEMRGLAFDFRRVDTVAGSDFFPRGRPDAPYTYRAPVAGDDGWPVGRAESVGFSRERLEQFVRGVIATPMDGVSAPEVHAVLVARHGTLVFEEYFHGATRDQAHDTRSAAKSMGSLLMGAAMARGLPLDTNTRVYEAMRAMAPPGPRDARQSALMLKHLLTMSSGLDCDDRDGDSPGNEDVVTDQDAPPDWWAVTLGLKMIREPGAQAVYCSVNPHLAGGVLRAVAHRPLVGMLDEFVAQPMGIRRYWLNLSPSNDLYLGGGMRFLPRDFLKLGQLVLDGGTWRGQRVATPEWMKRSTAPLVQLRTLRYGYLWWSIEYPFAGRTLRATFAGGNGGQLVMAIPELDLVVLIYAGNYSDPVMYQLQERLVPEQLLPALVRP